MFHPKKNIVLDFIKKCTGLFPSPSLHSPIPVVLVIFFLTDKSCPSLTILQVVGIYYKCIYKSLLWSQTEYR